MTGASNSQPPAYPGGGVRTGRRFGTASAQEGGGPADVVSSRPVRIRTPAAGVASARPTNTRYEVADQALTRSGGAARYGYHSAAATAEVVSSGRSRASTWTS